MQLSTANVRGYWSRYLEDYRTLMLDQSPEFVVQMEREWAFSKRHPTVWLGGLALYVVGDWLFVRVLEMDLQTANLMVFATYATGFLLFRHWRLWRRTGAETG